jgi:hypothetical protein
VCSDPIRVAIFVTNVVEPMWTTGKNARVHFADTAKAKYLKSFVDKKGRQNLTTDLPTNLPTKKGDKR